MIPVVTMVVYEEGFCMSTTDIIPKASCVVLHLRDIPRGGLHSLRVTHFGFGRCNSFFCRGRKAQSAVAGSYCSRRKMGQWEYEHVSILVRTIN